MTDFSPSEFGAAWQKFIEHVNEQIPPEHDAPLMADKLKAFINADPTTMTVLKENFLEREVPNLQVAFEKFLAQPGRSAEVAGFTGDHDHQGIGLSAIMGKVKWQAITEGPVQYRSVELNEDQRLQCVEKGVYLLEVDGIRMLALVRVGPAYFGAENVELEIMAPTVERAETIIAELRELMRTHNIYRGRIISLGGARGADDIRFHPLPPIEREAIILPPKLLETIERNTLTFTAQAPRLRAAKRHLKRGLLFHGPPGTGKTLTIMYLASQMKGRTVILMTGRVQGLVTQSCRLARALAPATVVLEDVDLIAQERNNEGSTGPLLFELLNEMDGLAPDTDVLFLLSTNRPDLLEPALVARPGRIDQAIEVPLPDADCRGRLLQLYGEGLTLSAADIASMVDRTEGASAAFIRELLRKAALIAADQTRESNDPLLVTDAHLREALHSIVEEGGPLTKKLLGVSPEATLGFGRRGK